MVSIIVFNAVYAQDPPPPSPHKTTEETFMNDRFGQGGTVKIKTTIRSEGFIITEETFYNEKKEIQEIVTVWKYPNKSQAVDSSIVYYVCGKPFAREFREYNDKKELRHYGKSFYRDGKTIKGFARALENGQWVTYRFEPDKYEPGKGEYVPITPPAPTTPNVPTPGVPTAPIAEPTAAVDLDPFVRPTNIVCCQTPKYTIFGGYSYLNAGQADQDLAMAAGAHLALAAMLNNKFGATVDFSVHSKEENEEKIMRMFLMGGVQFMLNQYEMKKQRDFVLFLRLMAGLAIENVKFSYGGMSDTDKASALALAAGFGSGYALWRNVFISLYADYIRTNFNDEGPSNIRVSAGVHFTIGCK